MALKLNERYPSRFNNPSADYPQGSFKNRTSPTAKDGSYLEKDWANDKEGFFQSLISASGLIPSGIADKVGASQYYDAMLTVLYAAARKTPVLTDTGAAGVYAAANTPALTALPFTGYMQRVNITNANTGASTYAPDGLSAKPIYGLGLQPLQGGELPVGVAVLMYLVQAGVNSGNGAWIIIESLGGRSQISPGTASSHAATVGQLQSGYGSFAIDSGSANACICNFTPAITTRSEGQVLRFKVNMANTGASTLNDGFGVVNLVGGAHAPLQGGELFSGGDALVQWNTNLYGGTYILLFCTGAPEQIAPATKSQHAVQAARVGVAGGLGRRNILINARGSINVRGYVSGTATTAANQFTIDRWYVVTSGQNLTFGDSGGIRTLTAPAGGVMQSIRGENIAGGVYVLTWTGTATATVNGTAVANGGTVTLPAATNARIKFAGGTFSLPQLELGSVATVFDLPNDDQETLICARYFQAPGVQWNIVGNAAAANQPVMDALYSFPRMISTPAVSTFSTSVVNVTIGSVFATPSALVQTAISPAIGYSKYLFVIYTLDADFI
ncbi:hypothetical protein [Pseudomonas sp.]|uniref:hypothetical protein n=1 Tax=Pseudomonas sp. TaxID=306 RepID=UPI003FD760CA